MCVLSIKPCMGQGAQWGQPFVPLRAPVPGREGELTPVILILHSTANLDFPVSLTLPQQSQSTG